jgi:uncharacterized membrane protein (DUF4010 family)
MNETLSVAIDFATSAGIGLLVGLERERNPLTKAGLRTFTLIAVLGTLTALAAEASGSVWLVAAGFVAVAAVLAAAYLADPRTTEVESGTTTVIAALAVFCLGVINYHGEGVLAVILGVAITALLYFKTELEGFSLRLTAQDIRSMLQFAALTAVVLPLLPNEPFGPYGVFNPFQIWLMVILISGVSLAGYVAWRLTLSRGGRVIRGGFVLTGLLGGVVSSTATTLVYSRYARAGTHSQAAALMIIVLANAAMLVRVLLISAIVAPAAVAAVASALLPALLLTAPALARAWRDAAGESPGDGGEYRNPTNLLAALAFAATYALILLVSAWLSQTVGAGGLYGLAVVSGMTDVDAITLSSLQLFNAEALGEHGAATAVALAVAANLLVKSGIATAAGGAALGRATLFALGPPLLGLAAGTMSLRAFG